MDSVNHDPWEYTHVVIDCDRSRPSVVEVPSWCDAGMETAVQTSELLLRVDGFDRAAGWVTLARACLEAAARETWPYSIPDLSTPDVDHDSAMDMLRSVALRSVGVWVELAGKTASLVTLRMLACDRPGSLARRVLRWWYR